MSEYEHGGYELNEKQHRYTEGLNDHGKGYQAGQEDLYTYATGIVQDWYGMKIVNDNQMLALKDLLHELEKTIYYTYNMED